MRGRTDDQATDSQVKSDGSANNAEGKGSQCDGLVVADNGESLPPYNLEEPGHKSSGVVFSSPHSGRAYFDCFVRASRLNLTSLRASEDAFVDQLFSSAPACGAPILSAIAPRAFVDLNRCPTDLDANLLDGATGQPANARVAAGLGVVPRIVAEGVAIYDGKLSLTDALTRIRRWHRPYHGKLQMLLQAARNTFGEALLIDCHSMPSGAVALSHRRGAAVDVVLGDRFGASADPKFVDAIEEAFVSAGFRVERNAPFAGGYITERYGRPDLGVSAVQIEIDRGVYLDQARIAPSADFAGVLEKLRPVVASICGLIRPKSLASPQMAAE